MKALIFGISGQDGFYLNKLLSTQNIEVIGISRTEHADWIKGDVKDFNFVSSLIKYNKPDYIFHFAANSTTSHTALFENHDTISTGTFNILEAVLQHSKQSKVFLSGSAVQFENKGLPINEETPFAALSPYAISRIQSVYAGRYYRNLGLQVYVGYFFNHDSPLRTDRHINQKIAMAIKRIAKGSNEKIEIGDSSVQKEFNYAEDLMWAIWQLMKQDLIQEAVIGSGIAYSIKDWIDTCFQLIGKSPSEYIIENASFKPEYRILVSDPQVLFSMGYRPKLSMQQLANIMMYIS